MKAEVPFFSTSLQSPKSIAKALARFFLALSVLVAIAPGTLSAAEENPLTIVQKLAKEGVKCPTYAEAVAKLVKAYPKDADAIMAEAVKNQPPCACEVVKAGIGALTPDGQTPDPKVVASVVAAIVQVIQTTNPDLLETVVDCAREVAPEASKDILAAISALYSGPPSTNGNGNTPPGTSNLPTPTPTPTPTPPTSPTPVTPVTPP